MTATLTPIHRSQSSARTGILMLFGNPPDPTIRRQQTWARSGILMLFGDPPSARRQPRTLLGGDPTA